MRKHSLKKYNLQETCDISGNCLDCNSNEHAIGTCLLRRHSTWVQQSYVTIACKVKVLRVNFKSARFYPCALPLPSISPENPFGASNEAPPSVRRCNLCRGERIWTSDLTDPNRALWNRFSIIVASRQFIVPHLNGGCFFMIAIHISLGYCKITFDYIQSCVTKLSL